MTSSIALKNLVKVIDSNDFGENSSIRSFKTKNPVSLIAQQEDEVKRIFDISILIFSIFMIIDHIKET